MAHERSAPRATGPVRVAVVLAVLVDLAVVLGTAVMAQDTKDSRSVVLLLLFALTSVVPVLVGALVVQRLPRNVVGWLLLAQGLCAGLVLMGDIYAEYGGLVHPGRLPAPGWVELVSSAAWPLLYVNLMLIGFLFPDGRFLGPRWKRLALGCLVGYGVFITAVVLGTDSFSGTLARLPSPSPALPRAVLAPFAFAGLAAVPVSLVASALSARRRFRQASGDERTRMLWFAGAALTIPGGLVLCWLDQAVTSGTGLLTFLGVTLFGVCVPGAIGVAILRHQLFDIELVLSRALTYGTLTGLVLAVYGGLLAGLGAVLGNRTASGLVGVGVVAVLIQPVHARLRRRAERWVYGDRADPFAALRRLADRLEETADPDDVVGVVTRSVAEALRVSQVRVELVRDDPTPSVPDASDVRVPLVHQGERLGDLVVTCPPGRQLSTADLGLLEGLASHAAIVVNAVHLTLDLQRSRARLVTAQEEERRRLRRDLHDGVGPSLAALVLKLNVLQATVDDPSSTELIGELRAETKDAIAEIRRLVDDLRPPALDEVGLLGALRQRAQALSGHGDPPLVVEVRGPESLPALSAAVEVAAYRVAMEAVTNVVKHARARLCVVTVSVSGDAVEVSVLDDGCGPGPDRRDGVGWTSMRERAEQLGGTFSVTRRAEGGTLVRAMLPSPTGAVVLP